MESKNLYSISVEIPNYSGPLEVLLDLAKTQKVDLTEISITKLADQFLIFIKNQKNINLETATEFLLMASWLAYLKSKLLLPDDENDDFKALEVAEKLKVQLPDIVYVYSQNSALSFLNMIKNYNLQNSWMNTNLMCISEKTSTILNEIKWKKIFLFNPGEEEFLLYKI